MTSEIRLVANVVTTKEEGIFRIKYLFAVGFPLHQISVSNTLVIVVELRDKNNSQNTPFCLC